jgi:murein DD-endopeptidase
MSARQFRARTLAAIGAILALATACATPSPVQEQRAAVRRQIAAAAEQMIGAPYRYGGQSPAGFDCSGLVAYSYAQAGIAGVPRTAAGLYQRSAPLRLESLLPGDLLFFRFGHARITHVAIYVGEGSFVHAHKSGHTVAPVRMDDPYWRREIASAGRLIEP